MAHHTSRRLVAPFASALLVMMLLPAAAAEAAEYGFLMGPANLATNPVNGQTVRLTGSGSFDPSAGAVVGGGNYTIRDAAGNVIDRGKWTADEFADFDALGGPSRGLQGGILHLAVTLHSNSGTERSGLLMTIVCPFDEDEGVFHEEDCGTTVGDFSEIAGGLAVFHIIHT